MNSVELREERADLAKKARAIQERAIAEDREVTPEENAEFDRIMDDVDKKMERIARLEKLESVESDLEAATPRQSRPLDSEAREQRKAEERGEVGERRNKEDFRHWMITGEARGSLRLAEQRDTIISTDAKGGFLILPVRLTNDLIKSVDDQVFMRGLATISNVTDAKKLGIRKMTSRMSDANWTTEVQAVTEDTSMAFDRRDMEPNLLTKLSKISIRTITLSTDAENIVRDELAYQFGITQEKAFLSGNGTAKPLGVFTASANGISTARDVAVTQAAQTTIDPDLLIDAKFSMKQAYLRGPKAAWLLHRTTVGKIRKLTIAGTAANYLWQPGLQAGEPDRILDIPYFMSEYVPATYTTGLYIGLLGNFSYYRIAQVNTVFLQRLVEKYADTNEVGFIGRMWVDGAPLLEEAFVRLKIA
jgi:HK97 family phage major capsid protein